MWMVNRAGICSTPLCTLLSPRREREICLLTILKYAESRFHKRGCFAGALLKSPEVRFPSTLMLLTSVQDLSSVE